MKRLILAIVAVAALVMQAPTGRASNAAVVLFDAFDVDGAGFVYNSDCGTNCNADGYYEIKGMSSKSVTYRIDAVDLSTGFIEIAIEGRTEIGNNTGVFNTFTLLIDQRDAVIPGEFQPIPEEFEEIRVGLRLTGTDSDPTDESVTVVFDRF